MSEERYTAEERDLPPDAEIDTGQPVALLADFELDAETGFLDRVRRRIERQLTTNDLLSMAWEVPRIVLLELLNLLAAVLPRSEDAEGGRNE